MTSQSFLIFNLIKFRQAHQIRTNNPTSNQKHDLKAYQKNKPLIR